MTYTDDQIKLLKQLRLNEGVRSKPYKDTVGKISIGVGRNLTDVGLRPDEIDYLLINDIKVAEDGLDKYLPWWRQLDSIRQRVMLDMTFNMGIQGFLGFKNTIAKVKAGDYKGAKQGMLGSKWAKQVGHRAERLAYMMETGNDHPDFR
jgi:lysozyme